MSDVTQPVRDQYQDVEQRHLADVVGMWTFLATEVMLFGGVFLAILVYRIAYPSAFAAGSHHLDKWLGGLNTLVLLTSSLTMALSVASARQGKTRAVYWLLIITAGLGIVFLAIKGFAYSREYGEGLMPHVGPPFPLPQKGAMLFFNLYYIGTGLHALHLLIGIVIVLTFAIRVRVGSLPMPHDQMTIDIGGLFWHLVDIVWVFLYPVFYLM